ncbi:MAG: hypothetical protein AAF226_09875, partial [Verrucomicrobiota bacterium]
EMEECDGCGFPIAAMGLQECPKCDYSSGASADQSELGVLEIDIAHSGESWEMAKEKMERALDKAMFHRHAGLKVIHGYGSTTGGHSVIGPRAIAYLRRLAEVHGGRYARDRYTPGASLIWLNR